LYSHWHICLFYATGELGKLEMVQEGILHKCIKQLIERKKTPNGSTARVADMSEDMECLCEILRTIGRRLDHERARRWMDQYFERIRVYQADTELPSRIRFMLQDVIELRSNGWQPRKLVLAEGAPKTIQQVIHSQSCHTLFIVVTLIQLTSLKTIGC
jgi:translation initiation factor 4G